MAWINLLTVALCIGFPVFIRKLERTGKLPSWLSTIIACYLVGILVSNLRLWPIDTTLVEETIAAGSMLFGLPLLLFEVRLRESLRNAGSMLACFVVCCLAGLISTAAIGYWFGDGLPDAPVISGMIVGLYTGGTPNVQAIGIALDAPADYMVLVQAADVLLGGAYLLGLITVLPTVYSYFFRPYQSTEAELLKEKQKTLDVEFKEKEFEAPEVNVVQTRSWAQFGVAILVAVIAVGLTYLLTGSLANATLLLLLLTTLSIVAGSLGVVEKLGPTYPLGEYFILIFSVALGLLADFRELAGSGMPLLYFSLLTLTATITLHLLASRLLNFDRDTVIISSVAGLYGPVFVVQVAAALGNTRLVGAGVAVSLLGFGVGNYLGVGLTWALRAING